MSNTPERIVLINEFEEGKYVWCNCPDPGTEEADSVDYIRADVVEKMLKTRGEKCAVAVSKKMVENAAALGAMSAGLVQACVDVGGE